VEKRPLGLRRVPYSAEHPEVYRQRSGGVLLAEGADWVAAIEELRRAYLTHADLNLAAGGR
jgi:phthalate 4,5-dioxygenase